MTDTDTAVVPLSLYSQALDEIYELRRALAYEAASVLADLSYRTYPKSRRAIAEARVEQMQQAARGEVRRAYACASSLALRRALADAGASETLTRSQWEREPARGAL